MSQVKKNDRVEVCIIGSGASGGVAAKVLTEKGFKVVVLERGKHLKPKDFGADELANVNRYYTVPDPLIAPRTLRYSSHEEAEVRQFSPLPYVVGGGTSKWTGWVPRFTSSDFVQKSLHGDIDGANVADWPISYYDLEPYYDKVEWALGVSGKAGANKYESPRSRDYPTPPLPNTKYAEKFHKGCKELGWNSYPTPSAMLSKPYNGRRESVQSAFTQHHGDPTGTKSNVLNVFLPDALATGKLDLRPDSYVRELTVDNQGRIKSAVYEDIDGNLIEQEADIFIVACNAIETARLLLLSKSGKFPNGLANNNDLVGRNLSLHEYSVAFGVFKDDPVYGWAGGGYISGSTHKFYETDYSRGFIGGGHIASTGAGLPLPIGFSIPNKPSWGSDSKKWDQQYFNHTMAVGVVIYDLPQLENRVDLDPNVKDAWGLPASRVTYDFHKNDLAQAKFLVDRAGEILEASGADTVNKVYIEKISGNALHQMGTARMGNDPETSVLNKYCQAHEVDNLYIADGSSFPTSTGANPTLSIMANAWRVAEHIATTRSGAYSRKMAVMDEY
ncbi:GMC family oxidoreductase [Radiobacillus sp. PE A8.2]|uniref:GMC family oxidoreductase n=1 Tax=Radiobacillus sp. PE A8.2 TaxID=3380349 RepID=UPI00388E5011